MPFCTDTLLTTEAIARIIFQDYQGNIAGPRELERMHTGFLPVALIP